MIVNSIETAPKDGSDILLYFAEFGWIQGRYEEADGYFGSDWSVIKLDSHGCGCCGFPNERPTHWSPLPEIN